MQRLFRLDDLVSLAERDEWQTPYWKPFFWHEVDKVRFGLKEARRNFTIATAILAATFALLPLVVWLGRNGQEYWAVLVAAIHIVLVNDNLSDWLEDLRDLQRELARRDKVELVARRYRESGRGELNLKGGRIG